MKRFPPVFTNLFRCTIGNVANTDLNSDIRKKKIANPRPILFEEIFRFSKTTIRHLIISRFSYGSLYACISSQN